MRWRRRSTVFLFKPLRHRVTDEQVALYLEEHEPSLQAMLISAVEASRRGETPLSPALVQRLVEQAIQACCTDNVSRRVEAAPLRRWGAMVVASAVVAVTLVLLVLPVLRNALAADPHPNAASRRPRPLQD